MGALADELVDVLGDAFSVPNPDARISTSRVGVLSVHAVAMDCICF